MVIARWESIDVLWVCLSAVLVLTGIVGALALLRLSGALNRLSKLLESTQESVVPVVEKAGGTLDRVNLQLDKVDLVTDSAVSAADSADTAVRAVSKAVTTPVKKVSAIAAGVSHGTSAFMAGNDVKRSMNAARDAARRREAEIAEELGRKDHRLATVGQQAAASGAAEAAEAADPESTWPESGWQVVEGTPPASAGDHESTAETQPV